ncbi:hypothetical protein ACTHR4_11200, partial [Neisseria sp. P0004.S009]|uniref:hypothetical protein n=1 Tax=Neisseria sp. P0004.S009 TaxID=3436673 RepID=UPI003F803A4F
RRGAPKKTLVKKTNLGTTPKSEKKTFSKKKNHPPPQKKPHKKPQTIQQHYHQTPRNRCRLRNKRPQILYMSSMHQQKKK